MLPNNSLSQLPGTVCHTAFSGNVGTRIIAQINYSFSVTNCCFSKRCDRLVRQRLPKKLS